jgi:DNA-binding NarL/FixJ family response regulator
MHAHPHLVQEMLEAGASGYVLKECAFEELAHAVRLAVAKDQVYLSPEASRVLVDDYLQIVRRDKTPGIPLLTSREREILQLVAEGKTSTQIAHTLCMSKRTVEKHRLHIMGKLKIPNLVELIKYAIREGLTEL